VNVFEKNFLEKKLEPFWIALLWPVVCLYWWWGLYDMFFKYPGGGLAGMVFGIFFIGVVAVVIGIPLALALIFVKQDIFRIGIVATLVIIFLAGYGKPPMLLVGFAGVMSVAAYFQARKARNEAASDIHVVGKRE
jgi:hypothetical protein